MVNSKTNSHFELSLIIIAILIPVFLDSLPNIAEKIIPFLPIPFKLNLVSLVSIILGVLWFAILLIGLAQLQKEENERVIFHNTLKWGTWGTISSLLAVIFAYLLFIISYSLGSEEIIYLLSLVAGLVAIVIGAIGPRLTSNINKEINSILNNKK